MLIKVFIRIIRVSEPVLFPGENVDVCNLRSSTEINTLIRNFMKRERFFLLGAKNGVKGSLEAYFFYFSIQVWHAQ
jgi:hypothetical protein